MGCVQAKPERRGPADCKDDKDLQALDDDLNASAEEVVRSTGLERFKRCLNHLMHSDEKIVKVILSCKKQILEAEGKEASMVMTANEKLLDRFLINEYFNNSLQTLQLCRLELQDFIDSAREIHSCITGRKCDLHRYVVWCLFAPSAASMAAPTVSSALTAHPCVAGVVAGGAVVYASSVLQVGQHWLLTLIEGYESTLEAHKGVIMSMEAGTGDAIKELGDIMYQVNKVIAKGDDPSCPI
ncbi:hypothetical protein M0R45_008031 [Rubus argutus]|uniref:Uncharacterized protein n=1 Tax=Rubus argutus TaxID=59490 RepID=A0AAW1Y3R4_RUBAR